MARTASGRMPALPEGSGRGKRSRKVSRLVALAGVGVLAAGISLLAFAPASGAAPKPTPTANATAAQQPNLSVTLRVTGSGYNPNGGSQLRLTDLPRVYGTGYVGCVANNKGDIDCSINTGAPYTKSTIRWEFDDLSGNLVSGPFTADVTPYSAPKNPQVTLCHATPPATAKNGWNELTISADALFKQGHDNHPADIIPAFVYTNKSGSDVTYPGKNLTTKWSGYTGQQILSNGCALPAPPPPQCQSTLKGAHGSAPVSAGSVTYNVGIPKPACSDLAVSADSYQLPATYDGSGKFDASASPQQYLPSARADLVIKAGQTSASVTKSLGVSCGWVQTDVYTGPHQDTVNWPAGNKGYLGGVIVNLGTCQTPPTQVTPVQPQHTTPDCTSRTETVTPGNQAGVVWSPAGSTVLKPGKNGPPGESVTYTATPAQGYVFPEGAQTSWTFVNNLDVSKCNTSSAPPSSSSHVPPTSGSPSTHHNQPPSTSAHPAQGSSTTAAQRAVGAATDMGPPASGSTNGLKALGIALVVIGLLMLGLECAHAAARRRA